MVSHTHTRTHTAVHFFLSNDLSREHLSKENEEKRRKYLQALDILVSKIQSAHPSIRPRMNTPAGTVKSPVGGMKPPAAPPPEEGELYVECDQQEEAEEYLAFEPSSDIPQEVYEAMEPTEADVSQEVYEEPGECVHMLASFPSSLPALQSLNAIETLVRRLAMRV